MDALVESAGAAREFKGAAAYVEADTAWRHWARHRSSFKVLPFSAWVHLNETSLEELTQRGIPDSAVLHAHYIVSREQVEAARVDVVGRYRQQAAAAVRAHAARRLIRIAPERVVVVDAQVDNGDTVVTAHWGAVPAAARKIPEWIVNGLDIGSSV
jgi:hypothetical protein